MNVSEELQRLIYTTLKSDAGVSALTTRVYDAVSGSPVFPYVSFGPADYVEADAECITAVEYTFQIDVWSRATGYVECKQIADAVKAALHKRDLSLTESSLVEMTVPLVRFMRDSDGITSHSAIQVRALVDTDYQ